MAARKEIDWSDLNPQKILVQVGPGIGDALLATPMIRSLRLAYPRSEIDVFIREGREGMLHGNPDVSRIISFAYRGAVSRYLGMIKRLAFRYDLSVSCSTSDRSFIAAILASRKRASVIPFFRLQNCWKRRLAQAWVEESHETHTLLQNSSLAESIGIEPRFQMVLPEADPEENRKISELLPGGRSFAVVHPYARTAFKMWTDDGWRKMIQFLIGMGHFIVITGGPQMEEVRYTAALAADFPTDSINAAGRFSLAAVASLLRQAAVYVGPDTGTTHLAAAAGIPTFAIFGPGNLPEWAPFPIDYKSGDQLYQNQSGLQCHGNTAVFRAGCSCSPLDRSCRQTMNDSSFCLQNLSTEPVLEALEAFLNQKR